MIFPTEELEERLEKKCISWVNVVYWGVLWTRLETKVVVIVVSPSLQNSLVVKNLIPNELCSYLHAWSGMRTDCGRAPLQERKCDHVHTLLLILGLGHLDLEGWRMHLQSKKNVRGLG